MGQKYHIKRSLADPEGEAKSATRAMHMDNNVPWTASAKGHTVLFAYNLSPNKTCTLFFECPKKEKNLCLRVWINTFWGLWGLGPCIGDGGCEAWKRGFGSGSLGARGCVPGLGARAIVWELGAMCQDWVLLSLELHARTGS